MENNCLAYLDDIVIFNKDFPSRLASLREIFHKFRLFNIKASGQQICGDHYSPAERNLRAIKEFPKPTIIKEVESSVGMANFFRKFIANFSLIAAPLYTLLKDCQKKWSSTHVELFAIISTLRFFRATIYGEHTTIFSDHTPLTFLLKHNMTHDNLARWVVVLQSYDVSSEYPKGSSNVVADALSRSVNKHDDAPESDDFVKFPVSTNTCRPRMYSVRSPIVYAGSPVTIRPYDALVE
ncbi:hypothetical protein ANCCEY_13729 [Ancylostoma ceylanicum]|uniref:Reverse transcriptase RNase H-like domain-containing protein n=1 Tax=Ancylostoma ceylanicum TaxID=53326 RepID=A0A0D6L6A3_9BILA|nr:hypothetical protein ANCCEY_13729 [Ancylostoma ceylanicum]